MENSFREIFLVEKYPGKSTCRSERQPSLMEKYEEKFYLESYKNVDEEIHLLNQKTLNFCFEGVEKLLKAQHREL